MLLGRPRLELTLAALYRRRCGRSSDFAQWHGWRDEQAALHEPVEHHSPHARVVVHVDLLRLFVGHLAGLRPRPQSAEAVEGRQQGGAIFADAPGPGLGRAGPEQGYLVGIAQHRPQHVGQRGFHALAGRGREVQVVEHNAEPKPFIWTADPNKIIQAVRRGHQVLDSIH